MIKTIDFAGIELDNYTVREMIMNVEKDMSDHGFHTIEEVNMDTLMLAETDELGPQSHRVCGTYRDCGKRNFRSCWCRILPAPS